MIDIFLYETTILCKGSIFSFNDIQRFKIQRFKIQDLMINDGSLR